MPANPFYPGYVPLNEEDVNPLYPGYYAGKPMPKPPISRDYIVPPAYNVEDFSFVNGLQMEMDGIPKAFWEEYWEDLKDNLKVTIKPPKNTDISEFYDYDTGQLPGASGLNININPLDWVHDPKKEAGKFVNHVFQTATGLDIQGSIKDGTIKYDTADFERRVADKLWRELTSEPTLSATGSKGRIAGEARFGDVLASGVLGVDKNPFYLGTDHGYDKVGEQYAKLQAGEDARLTRTTELRDFRTVALEAMHKEGEKLVSDQIAAGTLAANGVEDIAVRHLGKRLEYLKLLKDMDKAEDDLSGDLAKGIKGFRHKKDEGLPWEEGKAKAGDPMNIRAKLDEYKTKLEKQQKALAALRAGPDGLGPARNWKNAGIRAVGDNIGLSKPDATVDAYERYLSNKLNVLNGILSTSSATPGAFDVVGIQQKLMSVTTDAVIGKQGLGGQKLSKGNLMKPSLWVQAVEATSEFATSGRTSARTPKGGTTQKISSFAAVLEKMTPDSPAIRVKRLLDREARESRTKDLLDMYDDVTGGKMIEKHIFPVVKDRLKILTPGYLVDKALTKVQHFGFKIDENYLTNKQEKFFDSFGDRYKYRFDLNVDSQVISDRAAGIGGTWITTHVSTPRSFNLRNIKGGKHFSAIDSQKVNAMLGASPQDLTKLLTSDYATLAGITNLSDWMTRYSITKVGNKFYKAGITGALSKDDIVQLFKDDIAGKLGINLASMNDLTFTDLQSITSFNKWLKDNHGKLGSVDTTNQGDVAQLFMALRHENINPDSWKITKSYAGLLEQLYVKINRIQTRILNSKFGTKILIPFLRIKNIFSEHGMELLISKLTGKIVGWLTGALVGVGTSGIGLIILPVIKKVIGAVVEAIVLKTWRLSKGIIGGALSGNFNKAFNAVEKELNQTLRKAIFYSAIPAIIIFVVIGGDSRKLERLSTSPVEPTKNFSPVEGAQIPFSAKTRYALRKESLMASTDPTIANNNKLPVKQIPQPVKPQVLAANLMSSNLLAFNTSQCNSPKTNEIVNFSLDTFSHNGDGPEDPNRQEPYPNGSANVRYLLKITPQVTFVGDLSYTLDVVIKDINGSQETRAGGNPNPATGTIPKAVGNKLYELVYPSEDEGITPKGYYSGGGKGTHTIGRLTITTVNGTYCHEKEITVVDPQDLQCKALQEECDASKDMCCKGSCEGGKCCIKPGRGGCKSPKDCCSSGMCLNGTCEDELPSCGGATCDGFCCGDTCCPSGTGDSGSGGGSGGGCKDIDVKFKGVSNNFNQYYDRINELAKQYACPAGLDTNLIAAIITLESSGNPDAKNSVSWAAGWMQIMGKDSWVNGAQYYSAFSDRPMTADLLGINNQPTNVVWGVKILGMFYDAYGSVEKALNSYYGTSDPAIGEKTYAELVDDNCQNYAGYSCVGKSGGSRSGMCDFNAAGKKICPAPGGGGSGNGSGDGGGDNGGEACSADTCTGPGGCCGNPATCCYGTCENNVCISPHIGSCPIEPYDGLWARSWLSTDANTTYSEWIHGNDRYWAGNTEGACSYNIPLRAGVPIPKSNVHQGATCYSNGGRPWYGYARDAGGSPGQSVFLPNLGGVTNWERDGARSGCTRPNAGNGTGTFFRGTGSDGTAYGILLCHITPNGTTSGAPGTEVGVLYDQGDQTHLHLELEINGEAVPPEQYMCP